MVADLVRCVFLLGCYSMRSDLCGGLRVVCGFLVVVVVSIFGFGGWVGGLVGGFRGWCFGAWGFLVGGCF